MTPCRARSAPSGNDEQGEDQATVQGRSVGTKFLDENRRMSYRQERKARIRTDSSPFG